MSHHIPYMPDTKDASYFMYLYHVVFLNTEKQLHHHWVLQWPDVSLSENLWQKSQFAYRIPSVWQSLGNIGKSLQLG